MKNIKIPNLIAGLIVITPMFFNLSFFRLSGATGVELLTNYLVSFFILTLLFLIIYTGEIYKYRRIFFIVVAIGFFPSFIGNLIEARGQMGLTGTDIVKTEVPFCHIVIPLTIIPYVLTETIIFPARLFNHYASVYSMLLIWLLSSLILGRGWCSWICFYGGWDEASSSIGKKKYLNIKANTSFARYFNFTMLLFLVLVSLKTLSVVYCEWLCPFKLITEYSNTGDLTGYLQFILMVVLFFGLLIVLPYLTKKRFQCATFCPFGAIQSFFNKISPFIVKIDKSICINCNKCIDSCPTFSLTKLSIDSGDTHITCTLCGKCIDTCPKKAIKLKFKWLPKFDKVISVPLYKETINLILSPTTLLSYAGLLIGAIVSGGFISDSLTRLINLVLGSFL